MEPQIRYTKTSDGASIAFATMGAGPVVIILPSVHAFAARLRVVASQRALVEVLSSRFTVVLYDGRGMGMSSRDERAYELEQKLADLEAVTGAVGAQKLSLFGTLFGGLTAIAYAAGHPERVMNLVLTDTFASGERFYRESPTGRVLDALGAVTAEQWVTVTDMIGSRSIVSDAPVNTAQVIGELLRETWTADEFMAHRLAVRRTDMSGVLAAISAPTLVMASDAPSVVFEHSRELASAIPNARLTRLKVKWAGWDQRDYDILLSFLEEHADDAGPALALRTGAPSPVSAPSGTAVILFTDIVSSTELTERMGDGRFRDASRALDSGLRAAIRDAGGTAIDGKLLGDGVLATFPSAAHAVDGARRCLELSAASELGLHIGLHAGDVIREDNNVYGGAVNIASRICGLSAPGEILVSDVVRGMARSSAGVEFEDRGEQEMKGVGEPVRVYAVRWRG